MGCMKYAFAACLMMLCSCVALFGPPAEVSNPGDTYRECVRKEGGTARMHFRDGSDLGDEVWCQWWYAGPFCTIAFDRAEWEAWSKPVSVTTDGHIAIDLKTGDVEIDGKRVARPPEPRAKWVRYCMRNLIGEPSAYGGMR